MKEKIIKIIKKLELRTKLNYEYQKSKIRLFIKNYFEYNNRKYKLLFIKRKRKIKLVLNSSSSSFKSKVEVFTNRELLSTKQFNFNSLLFLNYNENSFFLGFF